MSGFELILFLFSGYNLGHLHERARSTPAGHVYIRASLEIQLFVDLNFFSRDKFPSHLEHQLHLSKVANSAGFKESLAEDKPGKQNFYQTWRAIEAEQNIHEEKPSTETVADGLALGQEGLGDAVPEVPGGHGGDLSWEGGGVGARE